MLSVCTPFLPSSFATPAADEDCTSELHQPSKPQSPERFQRHQFRCQILLGRNTPSITRRSCFSAIMLAKSTPLYLTLTEPMLSPPSMRLKRLWESDVSKSVLPLVSASRFFGYKGWVHKPSRRMFYCLGSMCVPPRTHCNLSYPLSFNTTAPRFLNCYI
jgi:hypothetical protein